MQGVNKHNGEPVAVKTFNQVSHMRPYDVQMREFEVLRKVKHQNIVKLLAIEDDQEGRGKVRKHISLLIKQCKRFILILGYCYGIMYWWELI